MSHGHTIVFSATPAFILIALMSLAQQSMFDMVVNTCNYSNRHTQLSSNIRESKTSIEVFPEGFLRGAQKEEDFYLLNLQRCF